MGEPKKKKCRYCGTTERLTLCQSIGAFGGWLCDGEECNEHADEESEEREAEAEEDRRWANG